MKKRFEWPTVDEFVICTVTKVFAQGAFVELDEYTGKEGMIHLSEVASGWIKNIRDHVREGQKIVCKVLAVDPKREHIDLSLRRVKESERRWKIKQSKQEQRAEKLLELAANRLGKNLEEAYEEVGFALQDKFGDLYSAFEVASKQKGALGDVVKDKRWADVLEEIAVSTVEPPSFKVSCYVDLSCPTSKGIEVIRSAMIEARDSTRGNGVEVDFYYVGSPRYRIEVKAPSYKTAESAMQKAAGIAIAAVKKAGGKGEISKAG